MVASAPNPAAPPPAVSPLRYYSVRSRLPSRTRADSNRAGPHMTWRATPHIIAPVMATERAARLFSGFYAVGEVLHLAAVHRGVGGPEIELPPFARSVHMADPTNRGVKQSIQCDKTGFATVVPDVKICVVRPRVGVIIISTPRAYYCPPQPVG